MTEPAERRTPVSPVPPPVTYALTGDEPPAEWEMITPEQAMAALGMMRRNRPLRKARVDRLCRDILSGRWRKNGETVKLGADGKWDDGQHRFTAIYRTGVAVPMLVVRGITHEDAFTVDSGASRTYGDRLRIAGIPKDRVLASITRRLWYWDVRRQYMLGSRDISPSDGELEEFRLKHEEELRLSLQVAEHAKESWLTPTILGTIAIVLRRIDPDKAGVFLKGLITGEELKGTDPAMVLRRRLQREAESEMRNYETRMAMVFIAWNKFRDGEQIDGIQLPRGRQITSQNYPLPY